MPTGPRGEKRPADVIGAAVMVMKIATGDITETPVQKSGRVRSGKAGAEARAKSLSPTDRKKIARKAASVRWNRK